MATPAAATLLASAAARDLVVDRAVADFDAVAARVLTLWGHRTLQAVALLDRLPSSALAVSTSRRNVALAGGFATTQIRELDTLAWRELLTRQLTRTATALAQAAGAADAIVARQRGWVAQTVDQLLTETDRVATEIALLVRRAVDSHQVVAEILLEVQEVLDALPARLRTQFDTAAMEWAQLTELDPDAATGPKRAYLYAGPADDRCRPFCAARVGRVWSRGAIDRMDNRQRPNTFLTRGGWNCRHVWRDVTPWPALAALADTNRVAPGLEARIHALLVAPRRPRRQLR